jgi:hypothetical protein
MALNSRIAYLEEQLQLLSGTQPRRHDTNNMPNPAPQTLETGNDYGRSPTSDAEGALAVMPSQP